MRGDRAYEDFVATGAYEFRAADDVVRLRNVVKFRWESVRRQSGEVVGGGLEFLVLNEDGLIGLDYQFIES